MTADSRTARAVYEALAQNAASAVRSTIRLQSTSTTGWIHARAMVAPHVKPIPADANNNNWPGRMSPSRRILT